MCFYNLVERLKNRWKSLTNTYRIELQKHKKPSGSHASPEVRWKYFSLLNFLNDYRDECLSLSNYNEPIEVIENAENDSMIEYLGHNENTYEIEFLDDTLEQHESEKPLQCLDNAKGSKKHRVNIDEEFSNILQKAENILNQNLNTDHFQMEIHKFMSSMAEKVIKANLDEDQIGEIQETVLKTINELLKKYRLQNGNM